MKLQYLFSRQKNHFIWDNGWIKVEFFEPRLHLKRHGIAKCRGEEDILYYYYTLRVSEKSRCRNKYRWKEVAKVDTYDFPALLSLLDILDCFLGDCKPNKQWSWYSVGDHERIYSLTYNTDSCWNEDFYEVTKNVRSRGKYEWYDAYIGCVSASSSTKGVRITGLDREDLEQLKLCAEEFLKFSIELYNEYNLQSAKVSCTAYRFANGKLCHYKEAEDGMSVNYDVIKEMFVVGDYISSGYRMHFEEEDFYSESFDGNTIAAITKKELLLSDGRVIPIDRISYMYVQPACEKLSYDKEAVTEDFCAILGEAEKEDFRNLTQEELFAKYHEAIIDRTWMCRNEHNFPQICENHHENVQEIVREIIQEIKDRITGKGS